MNLTTLLGRFYIEDNSFNNFRAETFNDVGAYNTYLNNLQDEYFFEIKMHIDKILLTNNPLSTIQIFLDSKISDFKEVENALIRRDEYIEKKRDVHRIALIEDSIGEKRMSELGKSYVSQVASIYRLIQDYFEDTIKTDVLLEYLLPFEKEFKENIFIPTRMEKLHRNCVNKSMDRLKKLYVFYFPENSTPQNEQLINRKRFIDYLHHPQKDALMKKLHELLDGNKGKVVAITIKALEQLGFIPVPDSRAALYKAMREEFGDIGSDQSINPIMNNFTQYPSEIEQHIKILKEVK